MSNYPIWWDKTITLYNKVVNPTTQQISWYRTVLEHCFWKYVNETYYVGTRGISTSGIKLETNDVICRIPKDDRFVGKSDWKELTDYTDKFTLGIGDIIVLGEVEDAINEYTAGQRSSDLIAKYKELDGCIEIRTFVINTGTGVGMEHYRVVGD